MLQHLAFGVSEMAVIGHLLANPHNLDDVAVDASLFSEPNASILRAMRRMRAHSMAIDAISLCEVLEAEGVSISLRELGDMQAIACAADALPARISRIVENGRRVQIARACYALAEQATSGELSADALLSMAQSQFADLDNASSAGEFVPLKSLLAKAIESIDARIQRGGTPEGQQTDLVDLNATLGGLRGGEMIVVAGRPGMGKTAFAMHVANHISKSAPVAVFALEMGELQTGYRILSAMSGTGMRRLVKETLDDGDWADLSSAVSRAQSMDQHWSFTDNPSVAQIRAMCTRLKRQRGLGLVVVDYLQLMDGDDGDNENRVQEIAKISRGLKRMAKALDVPVIALSQLSRKCEERQDKKPQASDLRDSGAIEQDADIIIGMWRPGHYWPDQNQNYCQAIVLKNRQGECGPVSLFCDMASQRFGNWAGEEPENRPVKRQVKFSMMEG